jgi:phosphoribosylamine---glycine ligase
MTTKVLLVGNGAREHAIAEAVCKSDVDFYAFMNAKNPGIAKLCKEYVVGDILNPDAISTWASSNKIELAVVGPENPLGEGVVDALEKEGILCASPAKSPARLETDKAFTRDLLKKYKVDCNPIYKVLSTADEVDEFVDSLSIEVAVKPAGLTGGKGVKIMGEHLKDYEEVKEYSKQIIKGIGTINQVVIEEKLIGEEFTLQAFVSEDEILGTPMVQDHKRAYEGDNGPNTGGMGSYSDAGYFLPFLNEDDYKTGLKMMRDALQAFKKETGEFYKGFLYGQFIATSNGLKLIEFNARLGDPEAMNILSIMEGDFVEVLKAIAQGGLGDVDISFPEKATVCKYLVPKGYPTEPAAGKIIQVDEEKIRANGAQVYYAAVDEENHQIKTSRSRAIGLVGIADSIEEAEKIAEDSMRYVKGPLEHRKDIGTQELLQKRFEHMKEIRG